MNLADVTVEQVFAVAGALGTVGGLVYAVGRFSHRFDDLAARHGALAKEAREAISDLQTRVGELEVLSARLTERFDSFEKLLARLEDRSSRIEEKLDDLRSRA